MGAICSKNRCRRFMKIKTFGSLVTFGLSIYMFILTSYYIENYPSVALIIAVLGALLLLIGIVLTYEVVTYWRAFKKLEEAMNPVRKVRFSSLLNVYQEYDQSFEEESISGGSPLECGIPWSYVNDDLVMTPDRPELGNLGRSWIRPREEDNSGSLCASGRGHRGKYPLFPQASTSQTSDTEATHAAGRLSPEISSVPSFEYWMSLPKDELASQSQSNAFRERNCLWYENSDNFPAPKETQELSAKDKELFDNDDGEEIIL